MRPNCESTTRMRSPAAEGVAAGRAARASTTRASRVMGNGPAEVPYRCAAMVVLPDPPDALPPAPRAFYDGVRTAVAELRPADIDADRMEVDFGDGGVAITFPHVRE